MVENNLFTSFGAVDEADFGRLRANHGRESLYHPVEGFRNPVLPTVARAQPHQLTISVEASLREQGSRRVRMSDRIVQPRL